MGRSGYSEWDDYDEASQWAMIRQSGARKAALRGKRGQAFLRRLAAALDAMPVKALIAIPEYPEGENADAAGRLGSPAGAVCVLGSLAAACGMKPHEIDATKHNDLAKMFDVAPTIVRDLEWENDQTYATGPDGATEDERRWKCLRHWVDENIATEPAAS